MDAKTKKHLQHQLVKLWDMIWDWMQYEEGWSWISKEYKKISNALMNSDPDIRKLKIDSINRQIQLLISEHKCTKCGWELEQRRSGTKVIYCKSCNQRYKAISKKV